MSLYRTLDEEGGDADRSSSMDPLKLAELSSLSKDSSIAGTTTGIISFIASCYIAWWIVIRSNDGVSTTFHRLLLGLTIADILSSICRVLSTRMAPKELDYFLYGAIGNVASCDVQGFFMYTGTYIAIGYNCSLCFYYLAIVKYNKTDAYIRQKIEPYLHGAPIAWALIPALVFIPMKAYNYTPTGGCFPIAHSPPHCDGYEYGDIPETFYLPSGEALDFTVPCGRGQKGDKLWPFFIFPSAFIAPIVIAVTMTMMYRSVLTTEKTRSKYGAIALKSTIHLKAKAEGGTDVNKQAPTSSMKLKSILRIGRKPKEQDTVNRNGSRAILNKALSYTIAYFATYLFIWIATVAYFANGKESVSPLLSKISAATQPLQGLYNFIVLFHPKTVSAKKTYEDISWFRAFLKAVTSRGGRKKKKTTKKKTSNRTGSRQNNGSGAGRGSKLRQSTCKTSVVNMDFDSELDHNTNLKNSMRMSTKPRSTTNLKNSMRMSNSMSTSNTMRMSSSMRMSNGPSKSKNHMGVRMQNTEEEKCEIEPPSNQSFPRKMATSLEIMESQQEMDPDEREDILPSNPHFAPEIIESNFEVDPDEKEDSLPSNTRFAPEIIESNFEVDPDEKEDFLL